MEKDGHLVYHQQDFFPELPTQKDIQQRVHANVCCGEPEGKIFGELHCEIKARGFRSGDLLKGVRYSDNVIRPKKQEKHDDNNENPEFDLLLALGVVAARVPKRLDNTVCDANVADRHDHTDAPEESIQVNHCHLMELKSSRPLQEHTAGDL